MDTVLSIVGQVLVVLGAAVFLTAALGLRRFPDPYARASSVATAGGLGVVFVTVGCALVSPDVGVLAKVVLAIVLQLITSAVGGVVIARAAVNSGHAFMPGTDTEALPHALTREWEGERQQ